MILHGVRISVAAALLCLIAPISFVTAQEQASDTAESYGPARTKVFSYFIVDGVSAAELEADQPGDAERGRKAFFDPELGGCARCHWIPGMDGAPDALIGPSLEDVGVRLASGVIRLWIINPRALKAGSSMPAYYSLTPAKERTPGDKPERKSPLLTPQEIEDLVAFLEGQSSAPAAANQ